MLGGKDVAVHMYIRGGRGLAMEYAREKQDQATPRSGICWQVDFWMQFWISLGLPRARMVQPGVIQKG